MDDVQSSTSTHADPVYTERLKKLDSWLDSNRKLLLGRIRQEVSGEDDLDVLQDAIRQAVRSLRRFRGDSELSTWFYTILKRAIIREIRRRAKHVRLQQAVDFDLPKRLVSSSRRRPASASARPPVSCPWCGVGQGVPPFVCHACKVADGQQPFGVPAGSIPDTPGASWRAPKQGDLPTEVVSKRKLELHLDMRRLSKEWSDLIGKRVTPSAFRARWDAWATGSLRNWERAPRPQHIAERSAQEVELICSAVRRAVEAAVPDDRVRIGLVRAADLADGDPPRLAVVAAAREIGRRPAFLRTEINRLKPLLQSRLEWVRP
jgi:RNA polymerase sigma factor (sigma-70 family)